MNAPRLLLLSGGLDSAALAYETSPEYSLFIDYGQRPAAAERRASQAIADALAIEHHEFDASCLRALGLGLLASDEHLDGGPSPEWWPFRNQLLATIGAAWIVRTLGIAGSAGTVVIGSVSSDGQRHVDGTIGFYRTLDQLVEMQEGAIRIETPAIHRSTSELIMSSGVGDEILAWTHSCHISSIPCGDCPGCHKRNQVLIELGRL